MEKLDPKQLKRPNRQLRIHSPQQESMLMASISEFGFLTPAVIADDLTIVTGILRVDAAIKLGIESIPVVRVSHLSRGQLEAFRIADNKIQEHGKWDEPALRDALVEALAIDIDIEALGFTTAEADIALAEPLSASVEEIITPPATSLIRVGDIFVAGSHRIMCGDAFCPEHYASLMRGAKAAMVFTDPPYNLSGRSIGGKGRFKHRQFVAANGELSDVEFEEYLRSGIARFAAHTTAGGLIYVCMDWRHVRHLLNAANALELELIDIVVWAKTGAGMGSFYRSQHELIVVLRVPGAPHRNNVELGRNGRHRTNLWSQAGANVFGPMRDEALAMHPTVKPVGLIMDAIKDCTQRADIILDSFGGSGSTLIAAQKVGRTARIIEIDPVYVETILNRYQRVFGVEAVHEETGLSFTEVVTQRASAGTESNVQSTRPRRRRSSAGG
jgi:DNA modification methylase